jgi:hypothetical protein
MKKPSYLWPAIWGLLGFAAVAWSIFIHDPERAHYIFLAGFLAMLKGDVLAVKAEVDCWRKL